MREYNHSYNYFAGMSDDAVARYQKDAVTGHRPTWKMGFNGGGAERMFREHGAADPFDVVARVRRAGRHAPSVRAAEARMVRNAERKAFDTLGLDIDADRGRHQGALQGAGEAPPSRRQWRRPLAGRPAARDHPGVQLSEVGEVLLTDEAMAAPPRLCLRYLISLPKIRSGTNSTTPGTKISSSVTTLTAIRNGIDSRV